MAAKIRLARKGRKNRAFYRIIVIDESSKREGKFVEQLGTYDPQTNPPTLKFDAKLLEKWQNCGAAPTDSVRKLLNL